MNLSDELQDLADSLSESGWKTKPEAEWTPDEHRAYHRWAQAERARQDAEAKATGKKIKVVCSMEDRQSEYDRKTLIGAFLRPTRFTLNFGGSTLTHYGPDHESSKTYVGVDLEEV